jgi:hypothetical protein
LAFTDSMNLTVWDIDSTVSDLSVGRMSLAMFGGLRYVHVSQTYNAYAAGNMPQFLVSSQSFNGLGPSVGLQARSPLGRLGLALYGIGRLGFLFGDDRHVSNGRTLDLLPASSLTGNNDFSERQRFVPTFDIEMGLEWTRSLGFAEFFFRAGGFAFGIPLGSGSSGYVSIGLIGVALNAGINF